MVTSSPPVGSSTIRSRGALARAMAMTTRWHMPPRELVRDRPWRRSSGSGMPTEPQQLDRAGARLGPRCGRCARTTRAICAPTGHRVQVLARLVGGERSPCRAGAGARLRPGQELRAPELTVPAHHAPRRGRAVPGWRGPARTCRCPTRPRRRGLARRRWRGDAVQDSRRPGAPRVSTPGQALEERVHDLRAAGGAHRRFTGSR